MSKRATVVLSLLGVFIAPAVVRAGDEPAVQGEESALPYLRELHAKVHRLWADNFLAMAATQLPKDHPINTMSRAAQLELVLSAEGKLLDVRVAKSSGSPEFDASAMDVVKASAPFGNAPEDVLSDDGKARVLWTFARDDRRCSGLTLARRDLALADAVKTMVAQGRDGAAVARLQKSDDAERLAGMDVFARAWLDGMEKDKALAVDVAAANAVAGDDRGAERLRKAAEKEPTLAVVHGLAALKIPICPLIKDYLNKGNSAEARERFLWALGEGTDGECLSFAIGTAKNHAAGRMERILALASLGHSDSAEAKAALKDVLKDPDPNIAAAAILAEARPGAGKSAVFRLTPLLRDKSVAVRAAAAAALVRVGGDAVLPQLFLVFKEKEPIVYTTLAPELAALTGAPSAEMLGRFLRKDDPRIRLAAARALATRHDEPAAKAQATLAKATTAELQLLAGPALDKDKRAAAVAAPTNEDFGASFSALLRGTGRIVGADWLLAQFDKLEPGTRVAMLGQWLGTRPKSQERSATIGPVR
jgi:TonB family protein